MWCSWSCPSEWLKCCCNVRGGGAAGPLQQHSNEVFVIETHPRDPRVFISAGHDGFIVIWDMFTGDKLNLFTLPSLS